MHNNFMRHGQALVVVLLILAVASALGLSAVSRSVNEINLSTTQDDSSQALSAAESGIEAVLEKNLSGSPLSAGSTGTAGTARYTVASTSTVGNATTFEVSKLLSSGESAVLFLKQTDSAGNFFNSSGNFIYPTNFTFNYLVCWGKSGTTVAGAALEATTYWSNLAGNIFSRSAPAIYVSSGGPAINGSISTNSAGANCPGYLYQNTVQFPGGVPLFTSFRMLRGSGPVFVNATSGGIFPAQGPVYEVEGQAGQTTRRVQVTDTYPAPLGILDNALFSGSGL